MRSVAVHLLGFLAGCLLQVKANDGFNGDVVILTGADSDTVCKTD